MTLDNVNIEYVKKVANAWPSSVTRSRKFTDWIVHTSIVKANVVIKKYLKNSEKIYLLIVFFIVKVVIYS